MDLEECIHVSNTTLQHLAAHCPGITELVSGFLYFLFGKLKAEETKAELHLIAEV